MYSHISMLTLCFSGNLLLVGPIGSHLSTLCKLALHVADLDTHTIDSSKQNTFFDGLRSAVRMTGSEGKTLTLFFDVSPHRFCLYVLSLLHLLAKILLKKLIALCIYIL